MSKLLVFFCLVLLSACGPKGKKVSADKPKFSVELCKSECQSIGMQMAYTDSIGGNYCRCKSRSDAPE